MVLLVFLESEKRQKKKKNFLIGKSASMAMIPIWRVGHHLGSMVEWVLSWEVGCNGRSMALKSVGKTILVSM